MIYRYSMRKRIACLLIGLLLLGIGVALSTCPKLGSSPISSPAYALTFLCPYSLGTCLIAINILFVVAQIIIMGKNFKMITLSQIVTICILGIFVDFGMWLTHFYIPENYILRIVEQLMGCFFIALGVVCQIASDFFLPGEGFIKCLCGKFKWNFGVIKICLDSSLVLLAIVISFSGTGTLQGVREGTVIAALLVGFFVRQLNNPLHNIKKTLLIRR